MWLFLTSPYFFSLSRVNLRFVKRYLIGLHIIRIYPYKFQLSTHREYYWHGFWEIFWMFPVPCYTLDSHKTRCSNVQVDSVGTFSMFRTASWQSFLLKDSSIAKAISILGADITVRFLVISYLYYLFCLHYAYISFVLCAIPSTCRLILYG